MANYTIEARSLDIVGVASHNFWVLRDPAGRVIRIGQPISLCLLEQIQTYFL